jgi:hypothetical protein
MTVPHYLVNPAPIVSTYTIPILYFDEKEHDKIKLEEFSRVLSPDKVDGKCPIFVYFLRCRLCMIFCLSFPQELFK